ncbi:MAG: hypothetical protein ACKVS8_05975 [Phycisphaerales bacterium]
MESKAEPNVVRQHERIQCRLAASVGVAQEMADRVVFSGLVCGSGRAGGTVVADLIDCSRGGLGLRMKVFVPKHTRLVVKAACGPMGEPGEFLVVAQRVKMLDRGPTYYVGASFPADANAAAAVEGLLVAARAAADVPKEPAHA